MGSEFLGINDILLAPVYYLLFWLIARGIAARISDREIRKFFGWAFHAKMIASILTVLIYAFYYKSGDTFFFFKRAVYLNQLLGKDIVTGVNVFLAAPGKYHEIAINYHLQQLRAVDTSSLLTTKIVAIINIFTFSVYTSSALALAFISFLCSWRFYRIMLKIYPSLYKPLAFVTLFIPSTLFWGSGIFKDTITYSALLLLFTCFYVAFIERRRFVLNIMVALVCIYVIGVIKSYILMAFVPALILFAIIKYQSNVKNVVIRYSLVPAAIILSVYGGILSLQVIGSQFDKFALDSIERKATDMQSWHTRVDEYEGGETSSYDLGEIDFSAVGLITAFPKAITVTYFRPFIWEVNSAVMLIAFLESFFFLYFTIRIIVIQERVIGALKKALSDPVLIMCLTFALSFGFAVGFTSYNFGALVRYKIPCLPFYALFLAVLRAHGQAATQQVRRAVAPQKQPAFS